MDCVEVEEMIEHGEKLGPRAGVKGLVDVSELPGIVCSLKLSRRRGGKGNAVVADAIIPYPEYFNKNGEEVVYELYSAKTKYQDQLLKNQLPPVLPQTGTLPAQLVPPDGPPELAFPRGVLGQIVVRVTVLSRSALLGAKEQSQKRRLKAKTTRAGEGVDDTHGEGDAGADNGWGSRMRSTASAVSKILPSAWTSNPAIIEHIADEAADLILEQSIGWLISTAVSSSFTNQQNLDTLHLERVRSSEKTLKGLCVCFAGYLCHVSFKGVTAVSDTVVMYLVQLHSGTLKSLDVMHCYRVTDESLTQVASCSARLELLNVSDTSQYGTTDATVAAASRCKQLRHFEAANLNLVTDSSVVTVLTQSLLQTLDVSGCQRVSDGMFQQLPSSHSTSSLKTLKLAYCDISDEGIYGLIGIAPHLSTLSVAYCPKISDGALSAAVHASQGSFTSLDFSGTCVGDQLVATTLKKCGQLRVLRLALCLNLSTTILDFLISDGRNLKLIDLTGAGGNVGGGGQMLRGEVLRNFALRRELEGCTFLADFHEKKTKTHETKKTPAATRRGSSNYCRSVAATSASSRESSFLPLVNARVLQQDNQDMGMF